MKLYISLISFTGILKISSIKLERESGRTNEKKVVAMET